MQYIHPILGTGVVALLLCAASLGLRSRGRGRRRAAMLARHARIAPWCLVAAAATWLAGILSTALLRSDITLADSLHFVTGTALLAVLGASFWSSRSALA